MEAIDFCCSAKFVYTSPFVVSPTLAVICTLFKECNIRELPHLRYFADVALFKKGALPAVFLIAESEEREARDMAHVAASCRIQQAGNLRSHHVLYQVLYMGARTKLSLRRIVPCRTTPSLPRRVICAVTPCLALLNALPDQHRIVLLRLRF